jgi:hypothetical protein
MRDELQEFIILRSTSDEFDAQEFTRLRQSIHERYNDFFSKRWMIICVIYEKYFNAYDITTLL